MSYAATNQFCCYEFSDNYQTWKFQNRKLRIIKEKAPNVILLEKGLHPRECTVKCSTLKKFLQLKVKTE